MGHSPCWLDGGPHVPSLRGASADGLRPRWTPGHRPSKPLGRLGAEGEVWPPDPVILPVPAWDVARTAHLSAQQILTEPPRAAGPGLAGLHTLLPPHTRPAGDAKALTFRTTARAENVSLRTVWEECLVPAQLLEFFFLFFPSDVAPSSGLSINAEPQQPLSRSETAPACGRHRRLARGGDRNPLPFTMHSSCWFWTRHRSEGRER